MNAEFMKSQISGAMSSYAGFTREQATQLLTVITEAPTGTSHQSVELGDYGTIAVNVTKPRAPGKEPSYLRATQTAKLVVRPGPSAKAITIIGPFIETDDLGAELTLRLSDQGLLIDCSPRPLRFTETRLDGLIIGDLSREDVRWSRPARSAPSAAPGGPREQPHEGNPNTDAPEGRKKKGPGSG